MFFSISKTKPQANISQLCAGFMVNALANSASIGFSLSVVPLLIRDMLKSAGFSLKVCNINCIALADQPSKLRRYEFLAVVNEVLSLKNSQQSRTNAATRHKR